MNKVEKKRQKEQYVVEEMIRLYCRKNHGKKGNASGGMCPECQKLADYAKQRSQKCPFMEQKTFCANCKVHCYCLLYTSPSPRDPKTSRMPSSA